MPPERVNLSRNRLDGVGGYFFHLRNDVFCYVALDVL
jgi:hypothetical protein